MGNNIGIDTNKNYTKYGEEVLQECKTSLEKANIINVPMVENKDDDKKDKEPIQGLAVEHQEDQESTYETTKCIMNFTHSASNAYAKAAKIENLSTSGSVSDKTGSSLSASRILETMENIDDAGKRHLSFLSEKAPDSGNVAGGINLYYENSTNQNTTTIFTNIENRWQNKEKTIYTEFDATFGRENSILKDGSDGVKKVVGNIAFNGRLDKKNFLYGAGAEYNSFSNSTRILDVHVGAKHKATGLGADLTRRTTFSKDEDTGEHLVTSNMKLKINILSNEFSDNSDTQYSPFSFDSESSALPSEVESMNTAAKNDAALYIKPDRKNGFDVDFDYNENECGFVANYNYNFCKDGNKILSVAPVAGIRDYTDTTETDNNESLKLTYGVIAQTGKVWGNGQSFKGTISAIGNRLVKKGNSPFDSDYVLANIEYNNPKAAFSAGVDAGIIKSGDSHSKYANVNASKQFKNSSLSVNVGISDFSISEENENLFSCMATYKYNIPYKTKK